MKYIRSTTDVKLEDLKFKKVVIPTFGESKEKIWVKYQGDKAWLQNHLFCTHPFPTWGLELGYDDIRHITNGLMEMLGKTPESSKFVLHPEAFDNMVKEGYLSEEGDLLDTYFEKLESIDKNSPESKAARDNLKITPIENSTKIISIGPADPTLN